MAEVAIPADHVGDVSLDIRWLSGKKETRFQIRNGIQCFHLKIIQCLGLSRNQCKPLSIVAELFDLRYHLIQR